MPHLNELNEKYASRGLSILSVTSEGAGQTEKWIKSNGVKYAYGYDSGGKLSRQMGVSGIPNAVLVNPAGQVVWQGNPYSLTDAIIEEHLAGSLKTPVWDWPKEASAVKKALLKRQFKKALEQAEKLDGQESAGIHESLEALVKSRAGALQVAYESGDFLAASDNAKLLAKECAGLEAGDLAKEIARKISADAGAKKIMKGQAAVRKLKAEEVKGQKDIEEMLKKLKRISKKYPDSAASREAETYIDRLEKKLRR